MQLSKHTLGPAEYLSLTLLALTAVTLIGLELKTAGWSFLVAGLISLALTPKPFYKYLTLIYASLATLGLVPIVTDVTNENYIRMGLSLSLALAIPFLIDRFIYKTKIIQFSFHHGRKWYRKEVAYIVVTAVIAYFLLPFYFESTQAYLNWTVDATTDGIIRLFIGTNALGIWDELFFVSTVLGILRKFMPFWQANLLQAVLFTSFLFDLGFTGWAPWVLYPFALTQGLIFKRTDSLLYVITIHLTLDLVLFLALINAHHPELVDIFLT